MEDRAQKKSAELLFQEEFQARCERQGAAIDLRAGLTIARECVSEVQNMVRQDCRYMRLTACDTMFAAVLNGLSTLEASSATAEVDFVETVRSVDPLELSKRAGRNNFSFKWILFAIGAVCALMCGLDTASRTYVYGRMGVIVFAVWAAMEMVQKLKRQILNSLISRLPSRLQKRVLKVLPKESVAREEETEREIKATAVLMVDLEKLGKYCEKQMLLIDQNLSSFPNERAKTDEEGQVPELIAHLMDQYYGKDITLTPIILDVISGELRERGLKYVEYTSETAAFFDTLPKRSTFTMEPAYISIEDGRVVRKGRAGVKKED